jgi:uncharacterized protein YecE (DUF72 family)
MSAEIRVGCSGYSYLEWGNGRFYPPGIGRGEILPFYARHFDVVEINRTYYGIPQPGVLASMLQRVPEDFVFTVKANREMTHNTENNDRAFKAFRLAIQSLIDAGRLGAVLAQFPFSYHNNIKNQDYLIQFRQQFMDVPLVLEFRNRSWLTSDTESYMRQHGVGFCNVDEPTLSGLLPPTEAVTSEVGYIRFHSRNREKWYGEGGAERYDYMYSEDELREWVPRIRNMAEQAKRLYVFFNNCHDGQAVLNARQMITMLAEEKLLVPTRTA